MAARTAQRNTAGPGKERMLHIRLDADLHRRLRVIVAAQDTTMQEWVSRTLATAVEATQGIDS